MLHSRVKGISGMSVVNNVHGTVYNGETQTLFIDTKEKAIAHLETVNKSNAIQHSKLE